MSQRVMPKIETLVIGIFCLAFIVWAWSKCSDKKSELNRRHASEDELDVERPSVRRDTVRAVAPQPVVVQQPVAAPPQMVGGTVVQRPGTPPPTGNPQPVAAPQPVQNQAVTQNPAPQPAVQNRIVLYSTIDGLKVRKEPGLKSTSVDKLKLYEDVSFLSQKTDWEESLSLGYELPAVTDHWVKIRTKRGKEGWVFGAGVHYYKMKAGEKK
jgi:Bacterial SH3 domain